MPNNKLIRIGIIGSGSQAKKIFEICIKQKKIKEILKYNYKEKFGYITSFKKIKSCDCIIIAAPTYTHHNYLKKLINYQGYIFLEKPGGSNSNQINYIFKNFNNKKLFINYNFQFSKLLKILNKLINTKKYGKTIKVDIGSCNGLAHKKEYNNWRFNKNLSKGIEELNIVHFLKISLSLFGKIKKIHKSLISSKKNKIITTANYNIETKNQIIIDIINSYDTPYDFYFNILLTNANIKYDGKKIYVHHPRDTFDTKNRFTKPPLKKIIEIDFENDWTNSLNISLNFFLEKVFKNKKFSKKEFTESINIAKIIFKN